MEVFVSLRTTLTTFLVGVLLLPEAAWSQQAAAAKPNPVAESGSLKIAAVEGEGAINNIRTRAATAPVVEVRDENNKPAVGAQVIFELPYAGPGGVFSGVMRYQTVKTDEQGRAAAKGFVPNDEEGRFNIKVTATMGDRAGGLVISQTNSRSTAQAKSSRKTLWVVLGVVVVGGIAGGIAATRGGSTAAGPVVNPVAITSGPITIGGPR